MMVSAQREFPRPSIRTCSSGGHYSRPGLVRFQRLTPLCGFWTNKDSFVVFAEAIRIKPFRSNLRVSKRKRVRLPEERQQVVLTRT